MRLVNDITPLLVLLLACGTSMTYGRRARYIPPKYEDYIDVDELESSSSTVAPVSRPASVATLAPRPTTPEASRTPPPNVSRTPPPNVTRTPPPNTSRTPPPNTSRTPPPNTSRTPPPNVSRTPPANTPTPPPNANTPRPSPRPQIPNMSMPSISIPPPMPIQQSIFPSGLFNPVQRPSVFPGMDAQGEGNFPNYEDYDVSAEPCRTPPCGTGIDPSIMSQNNFERPSGGFTFQMGGQQNAPQQPCRQGNCNTNFQVQPPTSVSILESFFPQFFSEA